MIWEALTCRAAVLALLSFDTRRTLTLASYVMALPTILARADLVASFAICAL